MATLLKKQKPIGVERFGMVAGRAHGDEGVVGSCRVITSSTARQAPPTACRAASHVPGAIEVSPSR